MGPKVKRTEEGIAYLVTYRCGCCQAALQAPAERPSAWMRCPSCGKGSLPPRHVLQLRPSPSLVTPGEEVLVIGPPPELPDMTPVAVAGPVHWDVQPAQTVSGTHDSSSTTRWPNRVEEPGNGPRVAYASVLFLSLTLLLFSYLDRSLIGTSVCGIVAIVAMLLLVLSGRS